jgi:hypothetical protein
MQVTKFEDEETIPQDVTESNDAESNNAGSGSNSPSMTVRNFSGTSLQPGQRSTVATTNPDSSNAIGSGVISKSDESTKTDNSPAASNRVYEATPKTGTIDTKGTSRRPNKSADQVTKTPRSSKSTPSQRKVVLDTSDSDSDTSDTHSEDAPSIPRSTVNKPPTNGVPTGASNAATRSATDPLVPPTPIPEKFSVPEIPQPRTATNSELPSKQPRIELPSQSPLAGPSKKDESTSVRTPDRPSPMFPGIANTQPNNSIPAANASPRELKSKVIADKSMAEATAPKANGPRNVLQGKTRGAIDTRIPQVRLRVEGSESILVGQSSPYEVIATNEGKETLHGLLVRASVPTAIRITDAEVTEGRFEADADDQDHGVVWELDQLPPNTSKSLKLMLSTSAAEHFALGLEWTVSPPLVQMPIAVQQPKLEVAIEGASEVDYGQRGKYRLRVRNPGNATAKGVKVEWLDVPTQKQEMLVGDVAAESERLVEIELAFDRPGAFPIRAIATSTESQLESQSRIDVQVRQSALLASWVGPEDFYEGSIASYELTLENGGEIAALDSVCAIEIPAGVEVIQKPANFKQKGNTLEWTIATIEKNGKLVFPIQLALNRSGLIDIKFRASSKTGQDTASSVTTKVDAVADLHLSVSDPVAPAPVGHSVVYEISITNRGKKAADDVYVVAQFSDGIEPTRMDGHTGKLIPGQAIFDAIPSIAPGKTLVLKIFAEASKPGTHRFRAAVKCQGSEDDLLEEGSTRYTSAATLGPNRK